MKIQYQLRKTISLALVLSSFLVTSTYANSKPVWNEISQAHSQNNQPGTIVEIAANNSEFKTLVAAVKAAGLEQTLSGKGLFTVFAPTNAAFAALPEGSLENLLKPENKKTLQKILTYHVLNGAVESKSLKRGRIKTVEGSSVDIGVSVKGRVRVNKARVIQADIKASNGIIHVIDRVILPPGIK
ncbi:fasciclin [Calothrix sp. HK-06]|nr:fasciclin [Calothrix sp. HK-06]